VNEKRVEGIVLKSIPFKEADRIVSVFTPNRGIMSLYVGGLSKSRPAKLNLTTPLTRGEFVFRKGRSDLHRFIDGTIIDLNLKLRRSYTHLEIGGKMVSAISNSQMPGKSAPALYALLTSFLKNIPDFTDPTPLWAAFQLKLLRHEGLLALQERCNACLHAPALRIVEGESRCITCASAHSFPFSKEEWALLLLLFNAKQFQSLKELSTPPLFIESIETLFSSRIHL